jgi:hypothetical protein
MRLLLLISSIFIIAACNLTQDDNSRSVLGDSLFTDNIKQAIWVIPANKSYVEPYSDSLSGIKHNQAGSDNNNQIDVTSWTSPNVNLCWYLSFTPGNYSVNIEANVEAKNTSEFLLTVSGIDNPDYNISKKITIRGISEFILYPNLLNIDIPIEGFYKISLSPVEKTGKEFASVRNIIFRTLDKGGQYNVRYANWLSSPAIYLTCELPKEVKCDWLYCEILVPEGDDPVHTFFNGLGFFRGYFGIQVISQTERRILFSVWDSSNEPVDRNLVNKEDRVTLVSKGDNIIAQGFENQGTGGQSYSVYPWVAGTPVELLLNVKPISDNNIVLSAWFKQKSIENNKWQYIASWRAPHDKRLFNSFYSFVDNFNTKTGEYYRKAYFYNYWGRDAATKSWIEFNDMKVQNTDGDNNSRSDFGSGVDTKNPERLYIWSGGYRSPEVKDMISAGKTGKLLVADFDSLQIVVDKLVSN